MSDDDLISVFDSEAGGNVGGDVSVSFFVSVVLGNVVEIVSAHNEGSLHLSGNNGAPIRIKKSLVKKDFPLIQNAT